MNRSSIKLVTDNDTQRSAEWTRGWFPGSCSHLDRMSLKTRRVVYSRGDIRRRRRRFSSRACVHAGAFSLASLAQRANTYTPSPRMHKYVQTRRGTPPAPRIHAFIIPYRCVCVWGEIEKERLETARGGGRKKEGVTQRDEMKGRDRERERAHGRHGSFAAGSNDPGCIDSWGCRAVVRVVVDGARGERGERKRKREGWR